MAERSTCDICGGETDWEPGDCLRDGCATIECECGATIHIEADTIYTVVECVPSRATEAARGTPGETR